MAETASIDHSLFKDRSVIITGGASGLGEATTRRFAQHGAYVTIADLQDDLGQKIASELSDKGQHVSFIKCNTTDWESSVAAFKHAINFSPYKTLDVAVLYAGTDGERKSIVDLVKEAGEPSLDHDPPRPTHRAIDINLIGVYLSSYLALHYFRLPPPAASAEATSKSGHKKSLVLISSYTGYIDLPYNVMYATSKYGVRGLFRCIRPQADAFHARINNIAPGYVLTPLTKKVHQIDSIDQPSKATGFVLPWTPIDHVIDAVSRCAVDEAVEGRSFMVVPSGYVDMREDVETGYGGEQLYKLLQEEGYTKIPSLFPQK